MRMPEVEHFLESKPDSLLKIIDKTAVEIFGHIEGMPFTPKPHKVATRKCSCEPLRATSFSFLFSLSSHNTQSQHRTLQHITAFHSHYAQVKLEEGGESGEEGRLKAGHYVGLKNLGFTCFVNATLQQLFMIPELRYELLEIPPEKIEATDDDAVRNLQKIFANLLLSEQKFYTPDYFYKTFKWLDGKLIDVKQQYDTDEFFNILIDKLEIELKKSEYGSLLRETMGIMFLDRVVSPDPSMPYTSEHAVLDYKIALDIKGKQTLQEALKAFFKVETLDGDNKIFCEKYNTKIKVEKQFLIQSTSKVLMIQLKRFEFNSETMQRKKITDPCSFPNKLNVYPWTKCEDKESEEMFEYELVGISVHSGTAEGGHYVAIIKERNRNSPNYGNWLKFNDTNVNPFDPKSIDDECFGKVRTVGELGVVMESTEEWEISIPTAYLLVYQRVADTSTKKPVVLEALRAEVEKHNISFTNAKLVPFPLTIVLQQRLC